MNAQQHVPVDDLAAYAAGDLDPTASVAVETHLVLCADCRSDVDAITNATAALTALDRPVMPADVASRVDAALAAERATPLATVAPLAPKRRRPSFAGIAAVAAGLALVAAIGVPLVTGGSDKPSTEAGRTNATTRRLSSGLDYKRGTLGATLTQALGGKTKDVGDTAGSAPLAGGGAVPGAVSPVPTAPAASELAVTSRELTTQRNALEVIEQDSGRLAACVEALSAGLAADTPVEARMPLVVDFATFAGQPAVLVAFPTVSQGDVRDDRIDVFVAGPRCGITAGDDDFLDFERIPRPAGL